MTAPGPINGSTMPGPVGPKGEPEDWPFPPYLNAEHPVYKENRAAWDREEKRLYGGDPVLDDLVRFDWEEVPGAHYAARKMTAHYLNLPRVHAELVTGHVSKKRPKPGAGLSFGSLGEVRGRESATGAPTRAEMLYYNTDGIGQDGKEWAAWWDGVYKRAEATGHRWVMVETPRVDPILGEIMTLRDELAGARPYLVEYSPLRVQTWWYHNGELQFAVLRPTVDEPYLQTGTLLMPQLAKRGWYLLVREGCAILGDEYKGGGWWLWDSQLRFIDRGDWSLTGGRIPLFPVFSEHDPGTDQHPAISRSQTMELGQCAVGIMNMISARDFDAFDAGMSKIFLLGVDPKVHKVITDAMQNSQVIPVPALNKEDGSVLVPQVHDGSTGAVAASVFKTVLDSKLAEAHETMMEKFTSAQTASGSKQVAGFAEASSPILVARARNRQQAENMAIYFAELRWGQTSSPSGYAIYPDDYELAPLIDDIDAAFDTLRRASAILPVKSVDLIVDLIIQALVERGVMPKNMTEDEVRQQLRDYYDQQIAQQQQQANLSGLNGLQTDKPGAPPPKNALPSVLPTEGGTPSGSSTPGGASTPSKPAA